MSSFANAQKRLQEIERPLSDAIMQVVDFANREGIALTAISLNKEQYKRFWLEQSAGCVYGQDLKKPDEIPAPQAIVINTHHGKIVFREEASLG